MPWQFEADYFTACNCDWGCPCNFNARPTEGRCMGWGLWRIERGHYDDTRLAELCFALYYKFPGLIEQGNGYACLYIDAQASDAQHHAIDMIGHGLAGGGIFELFGQQLVTEWLPNKQVNFEFNLQDGIGSVRIGAYGSADSELLGYPDGTVIRPEVKLPHGIEYKSGLMTNARRWQWQDDELLASYENKYGAVARVRFDETGCVA